MNKHDTLLICGENSENRKLLRSNLEEAFNLLESSNPRQSLMLLKQNLDCIAAVVVDTSWKNGESWELLWKENEDLFDQVPLIAISCGEDSSELARGFGIGAADVIPLDYDPYGMLKRIGNITELSLHKRNLEALVMEQADSLRHANDVMVDALSSIIEYRSVESGQHILRIRHFTRILLEEVARGCPEYGLTEESIRIISSASALHDVGKIAIPDAILTKPGKLTAEEWEVMKTHSKTGCEILMSLGDMGNPEYLRYAHNICHYHHERWDGRGYPEGLSGEQIPICAQVVGLADVYDALTSHRVYKDAVPFQTAVNMILKGECGTFSPKLLECFKRVMDPFRELSLAYADGLSPKTEQFDVVLPEPESKKVNDSVEMTRAKYLALVHYINAFLMELDMDRGLFHLIYNPFPEMTQFQNISTFNDIEHLAVDRLVVPREREQMHQFIHQEIPAFLDKGHRRASFRFHFRDQDEVEELFEITLIRLNPASPYRTLALLCRRLGESSSTGQSRTDMILSDSTYVCKYDEQFTLDRLTGNTRILGGYTQEEIFTLLDGHLIELVVPEDRQMLRDQFRQQLYRGTSVELEYRVQRRDGTVLWVLNRSRLVIGPDGEERIHTFLTDISSTKQDYETLHGKLSRYELILAQTENVLFEWDVENDTISFSDTWERIFGFSPVSEDTSSVLRNGSYFHPDDLPVLLDRVRDIQNGSNYEVAEVRVANSGGRYLWCRFRASAVRGKDDRLSKIAGIIINIDAEKRAERALQDRAERDALTRLLQKNVARQRTEEYLSQYPNGATCALLIIDLDNFKQVNDQFGHLFGDTVLTRAAAEIRKLFRHQDILARIGGDEFMVVMRGVSERQLVENRCAQLLAALRGVFREKGSKLPLSCSIGIAMSPTDGTAYQDLFKKADQALYLAKAQGKNSFVFYNADDINFRQYKKQVTSINNRIDSDEQPGLADNSLVQYAFQRLYTAKDVDASVNEILRLAGELMNVSRVYIFENSEDNRFCSNTYEWCNRGIQPEIDNLQHISYEADIPGYVESYDENGILYCPDIMNLSQEVYDVVAPQGIKSMLHCAIREGGVFRGYIGFDECTENRLWTKEQIEALSYLSETLSVFLLKKRAEEKTAKRANDLNSILDNQNAWIYIIDPDTCQLKYLNAKTRALAPQVTEGMLCYKALMGLPDRCPGCPSMNIHQKKTDSAVLYNEQFDLRTLAEATLIQWEGEESCLLTCRKLPDVQKDA